MGESWGVQFFCPRGNSVTEYIPHGIGNPYLPFFHLQDNPSSARDAVFE